MPTKQAKINWNRRPKIHESVKNVLDDKFIAAMWKVAKLLHARKIRAITNAQVTKLMRHELKLNTCTIFYMDKVTAPCGSPMCIAGHTGYHAGLRGDAIDDWYQDMARYNDELDKLFHYANPDKPGLAARAIHNYLKTGNGTWPGTEIEEEDFKEEFRLDERY